MRLLHAFLWLIARIVPRSSRRRWIEEWRAELEYGRRSMILGTLPDAWALRRLQWTGAWHTDAKQTIRSLARSPWHVVTVSMCLGIGIAVSVTTFSILAAILSGDMPGIRDRSTIMKIVLTLDESWGRTWSGASRNDYAILREGTPHMQRIAAEGSWQFAVNTPQTGPIAVDGQFVSGNYFEVLGTQPALGRLLAPSDDQPGAPPVAVLSHAFWSGRLGAPAEIVGSTIQVGGLQVLVAGIAPEHFSGTDFGNLGEPPGARHKLYLPLSLSPTLARALDDDEAWLNLAGRASSGITTDALAAELQPLAGAIERRNPRDRRNAAILVMHSGASAGDTLPVVAAIVALLMAAPLTVLAIGCANVANLQLVRASRRGRELAVRLSIGASRAQLVRLLTLEAAVLAVAACGAGWMGTALLLRISARLIPFHVEIEWPVLAFIGAIAALVVVATGVLPAWLATRPGDGMSLSGASRSTATGAARIRRALVVAQVALCLVLLFTAALFTRSLDALAGRIPLVANDVVVTDLRFDTLGYTGAQRAAFVEELQQRLRRDGRVAAVGLNSVAPLRQGGRRFWLAGDSEERLRWADGGDVTTDWFGASGLEIVRGRTFTNDDARHGATAIIDQAFVDKYGLTEPVLGTLLRVERVRSERKDARSINHDQASEVETVTIVGVVTNAMSRPMSPQPPANIYLPMREVPGYVAVYARSASQSDVRDQMRQTIAALDPELPAIEISTLAARFENAAGDLRLLAQAASGLGSAALLLAVAGVYSVIAFFVSLRTHEFGIRLAVGARPGDITTLIVRQASRLVGAGLVAGLVLGVPVLMFLEKAFRHTSAFDAVGVLAPIAALTATAFAAALIPARRAARVDPCSALRAE